MRIALFAETFLPKWDGVANTLCYLLEHLGATGHSSLMFAPRGAPAIYAQTPIIGLPCFKFPLYPDLRLAFPWVSVKNKLQAFRPDLIHIISPTFLGLVGLRHAREFDLPLIASYHTNVPDYAQRYGLPWLREPLWVYFRAIHNAANLNLCPSRATREELMAHGFERVRIWGRGVDTQRFNPAHQNREWRERLSGGHPNAPVLLFVGRLAPEKRIEWLRPLLEACPQARLAIVGDGPARPQLEQLFAGTPTVFTGYLKGEALAQAYASADLFVFPSPTETFGNVVLEAMASGLPAVVARAGGPMDHVRDGETGMTFAPDDMEEMIAHVRRLLADPALLNTLRVHARAYAETQTWPATLDGLLREYETVIAEYKPRRRRVPATRSQTKMRPTVHIPWP